MTAEKTGERTAETVGKTAETIVAATTTTEVAHSGPSNSRDSARRTRSVACGGRPILGKWWRSSIRRPTSSSTGPTERHDDGVPFSVGG